MFKSYRLLIAICIFIFTKHTNAQDYKTIIKDHLSANRSSFGISTEDVSGLTIADEVFSSKSETTHVYAVQKINNIEVFNGTVNVAFKDGSIIHVASNLQQDIASRVNAEYPVLTPIQAATSAANLLGLGSSNFSLSQTMSSQEFVLTQGGVSLEMVPVKLVYQSLEDNTLKLAWDLSIHTLDSSSWWSVRVDAITGDILSKHNWIANCSFDTHTHNKSQRVIPKKKQTRSGFTFRTKESNMILAGEQYNVFAIPLESPNHGSNSIVVDPQDPIASPFGWHDIDGIEGPEFTITRGNNVLAQTDFDDNLNTLEDSPEGGEDLNFDFEYNFNSAPINMIDAVTTNLFYWNNILHDITYQYGFDEASGNFQETNYTGQGSPSDFVVAGSHVGTVSCNDPNTNCLNNATFGTPPDGNNPGMRMFLFSPGGEAGESLTINGGSLDGSYIGPSAAFGDSLPDDGTSLDGDLALIQDDNAGASTDSIDACDAVTNGTDLDGKIIVIRRGTCEFGVKILAAENEGAIAVIMVNNANTDPFAMGPGAVGGQVTIPSIMVNQADGEAIIAALQAGEEINVSLVNTGPFQLDGSVDNGIIAHEYAHGISNRLTGGRFNAGCLQNQENMGEGWSDYFGIVLTMTANDTGELGRGIGTYASGQPVDGPGIRPARYSIDTSINSLTYDDVNNPNISRPHGIGTVWATILWDMTWAFIDEYGFDEDFYTGTGGNNIAIQLVMDGMKLQSCSPGFIDGRDGILAAVEINTMIPEDEKDFATCTIWNVFAARGVGFSADQGSSNDRFDQTEAFDIPADVIENCEELLSVNENDLDAIFSIYPNPSNGEITLNVAGSFGDGQIRIYDINGREVYNKFATLEGNVFVNATGLSRGVYIINITSDTHNYTSKLIIE